MRFIELINAKNTNSLFTVYLKISFLEWETVLALSLSTSPLELKNLSKFLFIYPAEKIELLRMWVIVLTVVQSVT